MFRRTYQTENSLISIEGVEIKVFRKNIKNIYIRVYPEKGEVRVSAPRNIRQEHIDAFIHSKVSWIRKKLKDRKADQPQLKKNFTEGEIHCLWGKERLLKIKETSKRPHVEVGDDTLTIFAKPGSDSKKRFAIVNTWARKELKEIVQELVEKYEPIMGVDVSEIGIKKMKTRWGSCNIRAGRIWLNSELIKKDPVCLEMVVVHEMVHLLERLHSKKFYRYMDVFFPEWKYAEQLLKA